MSVIEKKGPVTLRDYERLPEGAPFELIDGVLIHRVTGERFFDVEPILEKAREDVMSPLPTPRHQRIALRFHAKLQQYALPRSAGEAFAAPLDIPLRDSRVQPDVLFIAHERQHIVGEKRIEGPPDLVMEVLSPATAYYDLRLKKVAYYGAGVQEYWIADPMATTIEVYVPGDSDYRLDQSVSGEEPAASRLLDGFVVTPASLFT